MDDAQGIVLLALQRAGVVLPKDVQSVGDLRPEQLVPIYIHALTLIRGSPVPGLPTEFPQQRAERFRVCADLVVAFQQLGYLADLSFHQFLYSTEADTHRLLRFLLDQLSQTPTSTGRGRGTPRRGRGRLGVDDLGGSKISATVRHALSVCWEEASRSSQGAYGKDGSSKFPSQITDTGQGLESSEPDEKRMAWGCPFRTCSLRLMSASGNKKQPPLITIQAKPRAFLVPSVLELNSRNAEKSATLADAQMTHIARQVEATSLSEQRPPKVISHGVLLPSRDVFSQAEDAVGSPSEEVIEESPSAAAEDLKDPDALSEQQREVFKLEEDISTLTLQAQQMVENTAAARGKSAELRDLHREAIEKADAVDRIHSLMKEAVDLAVDDSRLPEAVVKELEVTVEERQETLQALQGEWDNVKSRLEEKVADSEHNAEARNSKVQSKLQKMRDTRQEVKDMTSKLRTREAEEGQLSAELEKVVKGASRATYVRRITELIRNSKKQDADINRIINDTRELQREGNMAQDKLRRLHALVDEIVFRDAKKDPVCKQAYRLLTNVHGNFENIVEKVLEMDKIGREISEMQVKLEDLEKRSLDTASVEADLEAVIAENRTLEKRLAEIAAQNL